jgi:hypothetical protein
MLMWYIVLVPIIMVAVVGAHVLLVQARGVAHPIDAHAAEAGGKAAIRAAPRGYVGNRLNSWAPVPLQVYCWSWTPLVVDAPGVSMHRPELSATKL